MSFPATKNKILFLVCLLPLAAALLNSSYFGSQGLTAYFGYTVTASFATVFICLKLAEDKVKPLRSIPLHLIFILILTLYIFFHGIITHTIGIVHYYWLASSVWVLAMNTYQWHGSATPLYMGITFLAFIESVFVILQALNILPVKNSFFSCTGTWENPNVTAVFLAMSMYAVQQVLPVLRLKLGFGLLAVLLVAIVLLQCRTAWIVSVILLCSTHNKKVVALIIAGLFTGLICFHFKQASAVGRVSIWQNTLELILKQPVQGQGFGQFEKQYNSFIAGRPSPGNDHVNMAYNDFLELGVEGGIPAVLLWVGFMVAMWRYNKKRKYTQLPLICFLIIQLTNFAFQAIPAFSLFFLYTCIPALETPEVQGALAMPVSSGDKKMINARPRLLYLGGITIISMLLLFYQIKLGKAFYHMNAIAQTLSAKEATEAYQELESELVGYSSFHEKYGDAFLKLKDYHAALIQYLKAIRTANGPDLLLKCGYCYQQRKQYDSSEYYFGMAANLQPYKIFPRMALLKMYQQKGDSLNTILKAREIMDMSLRVETPQAMEMKAYAAKLVRGNCKL